MNIQFRVDGIRELQTKFTRLDTRLGWGLKKVARQEIEKVMEESRQEVPTSTGALRDSAFIKQDYRGNLSFGYGGPNAQINPETGESTEDYMVAVHENLQAIHPHGKAKFLEDPVNRFAQRLEHTLLQRLASFFRF